MIKYLYDLIFSSFYKPIEAFIERPWDKQLKTFHYLISHGQRTYFGEKNNFDNIKTHLFNYKNIKLIIIVDTTY